MNIVKNILYFEIYILHILLVFFFISRQLYEELNKIVTFIKVYLPMPCIDNVCLNVKNNLTKFGCPVGHIPYAVQLIDWLF